MLIGMSILLATWWNDEKEHSSRGPRIDSSMKFSFSFFGSKSVSSIYFEKIFSLRDFVMVEHPIQSAPRVSFMSAYLFLALISFIER
jgi:hypothetical protein